MSEPSPNNSPEAAPADWRDANREVIAASNAWVEANGLPLRDHRLF